MARRLLESLNGVGVIHAGELELRTTSYKLMFWSDDQPAPGEASMPSIDGHIDIGGIPEALVLAGPETLTLTIEDGRRMAFQLTSSTGAIVGRGWLP